MSLTIPFTGRREKAKDKRRKHRADDRIAELKAAHAAEIARLGDEMKLLRDDNVRLLNRQAAADDYFALLWNDVLVTNQALVVKEGLRQEAEVAAAQMRMDRDELLEESAEWRVEAQTLRARLAPFLAAEANANAVTVPPMVRDTSAIEDQATGPIYVQTLRDAAAAGLLGPVTDPGRVSQ